ncbi:hypothetical protein [Pseudodesulfovibrio senegalensis]|uniref:Uncharacterized protein n=1 Tax=Pseudodesulfovibrio senegalensis TaxID=1721087 RepID=A0A6N6N2J3_9BACT|nr:hypothetical protein [Pseudodesulfovibrio senegalensis]KAB1442161.1 hypothetical protein F8A88_06765 [Pseudodesulfovibrio senegalensis]
MIDKSSAMNTILRKLDKMDIGQGLDLRTYKRNRAILIRRTGPDSFAVVQAGYESNTFEENGTSIKKRLKTLFKKEFPRSTKIRVYALDENAPLRPETRKTI